MGGEIASYSQTRKGVERGEEVGHTPSFLAAGICAPLTGDPAEGVGDPQRAKATWCIWGGRSPAWLET